MIIKRHYKLEIRSIGRCPRRSGSPTRDSSLDPLSLAVRQGKQRLVASLRESVVRVTSSSTYHSLFSTSGLRYRDKNLTSFPLRYRPDVLERPRIDFKAYERKKPHTSFKTACTRFLGSIFHFHVFLAKTLHFPTKYRLFRLVT